MDDVVRRIPPHSLEAEQSVIGAIIFENSCIDDVVAIIDQHDFYQPDLKYIFEACKKLSRLNKSIDLVTLKEALGEDFERVGGTEYITKIVLSIHTSAHVKDYCQIIKEKSYMRKTIKYAQDIISNVYEGSDMDAITRLMAEMPTIDFTDTSKHKSTLELMQNTVDDVLTRMDSDTTDLRGYPTGIPTLDEATGGMKPGELIGIKADPNVGKSVFALNICQHLGRQGVETGYFAYEMIGEQFGYRLATSEIKVPIGSLVNPKKNLKGNMKFLKRIHKYKEDSVNNIHIFSADQLPKRTVGEIEAKLRMFPNIKVIVVDYLQLLSHPSITGMDAYTENLRDLKGLSTKYKIPIVVVLGVTRKGDIRGTNEIDHDLDQLYEITREKYGETQEEREKAHINNLKGRDGKICKARVKFFEDYITFKEMDEHGNARS